MSLHVPAHVWAALRVALWVSRLATLHGAVCIAGCVVDPSFL